LTLGYGAARTRDPERARTALLAAGLAAVPAALGAAVVASPFWAAVAVVGGGVLGVLAVNARLLPLFLVLTMFVESLAFGPGVRIGRVAGALALAIVLYQLVVRGRAGLRWNGLLAAVAAYGLLVLASAYWAADGTIVVEILLSYGLAVIYMLAFALLLRSEADTARVFATLALGALAFGALSLGAYATSGGGDVRASGLQGDPNYFSVVQVVALAPTLALAALERRPGRRLGYYAVVATIALSVAVSFSRTGIIILGAVVLATLVLPSRLFFQRSAHKGLYALALGVAAVAIGLVAATPVVERLQTIIEPEAATGDRGAGRLDLWRAAWHGFKEEPWLGMGAGSYQARSLELLQTTPGVDTTRSYVREGRVVHNMYLETLTELGVVGLGLLLVMLGLTARYLVAAYRRARAARDGPLERAVAAVLVTFFAFLLSGFFISNQLSKPLWILLGMALAFDVISRRRLEQVDAVDVPGPADPRPGLARFGP
jgi:O-antigen ligase